MSEPSKDHASFLAALEVLHSEVGIRRIMLEGNGATNGALLKVGLVDELSLIIARSVEGVAVTIDTIFVEGASE